MNKTKHKVTRTRGKNKREAFKRQRLRPLKKGH